MMSKTRHSPIRAILSEGGASLALLNVEISRGGPQWLRYKDLPSRLAHHWNAFEGFLTRLSEGRHLYVVGRFDGPASGARSHAYEEVGTFLAGRGAKAWTGAFGPCQSPGELHALYEQNLYDEYWYVVSVRLLPSTAVAGLADPKVGPGRFHEHARSVAGTDCLTLVECVDRDCMTLGFGACQTDPVLIALKTSLAEEGLELKLVGQVP